MSAIALTETAKQVAGVAYKTCSKCGKTLPLTEFYRNKRNSDGHHPQCKECMNKDFKSERERKKASLILKLADFTDQALFTELKRRGYAGELLFTKKINI